jgi:hypothetical protein
MSIVVSFVGWTPPERFDGNPWTDAQIEEAPDPTDGPWTLIDTIALSPLDADPTDPVLRSLTTSNGTTADQWYRVIFVDASSGTSEPTTPVQNTGSQIAPFATVDELARILKLGVRGPLTEDQEEALQRVLMTAAGEIRHEIDLADDTSLDAWELDLCTQVNLDRAADLWRHTESQPGILGVVDEASQPTFGRYSWARYAARLSPIKDQWGVA